jgi:hypothetical protein
VPPLSTSQNSVDSLPPRGYTIDQLAAYIKRSLGEGIFVVELTQQQILDAINDSLQHYSLWRPRIVYGAVTLSAGKFDYLNGVDLGTGPAFVNFVQRTPVPTALFWGNLIGVAPLMMNGMDEWDMFLRWQKTWARVSSSQPDWTYDEAEKILYIHNPNERFYCGVGAYVSYTNVVNLDPYGADWVKKYALQKARLSYAEIMSKFSGAIPGPVQNLQLDQQKRDKAEAQLEKLEKELFGAQISTPLSID